MGLAVRSIQARAGDPFITLVAFRRLLSQLTSRVAAHLFSQELQDCLQTCLSQRTTDPVTRDAEDPCGERKPGSPHTPRGTEGQSCPPPVNERFETIIERHASHQDPETWLWLLRKAKKRGKQSLEPGSGD
jgi:hypothetical protein